MSVCAWCVCVRVCDGSLGGGGGIFHSFCLVQLPCHIFLGHASHMLFTVALHHAREPLYSNSAVIAWWSQSTGGKFGVFMCTLLLKNVINFLIFYF